MTEEEWLSCTDPAALYDLLYRRKRPSRARNGHFFNETGIIWNKSAFEIFTEKKGTPEAENLAFLIRCFFGNPFRPVVFDPAWRTESAVGLAAGIYEERAFERMPILADALQDAGCEHPDILSHCREPGVHVRGCWVVDLLLGKS